ncbi:RxLR effector protein PexRD1 [Phytophthora ramorum]|uniref:RxLR effector protein PexRD1 n=1 Tax=Phytophthora ramorum TaxID=164328 RepID=UPI0030AA31C2|nr:RxLR effector protein PexRD1 [Phytophthora ramorum]
MRVRLLLAAATLLASIDATTSTIQLKASRVWSSKPQNDRRGLRSNEAVGLENDSVADNDNGTADESGGSEERAIDPAVIAKFEAKMDDVKVEAMFRHWFQGGKTLADVRTLLSLPAKGDAVTYAHWSMYLKYLDFYKEQQAFAAAVAKAEVIKLRFTYKNWFLDRKSSKQVREILELPPTGNAAGYANWEKYLDYLKYCEEISKQYT